MISISVVSCDGAPVSAASATFDGAGGSIGRAEGNRLVLSDPDRSISRVHAEIVSAGGGRFAIVNRGGSAIVLNGVSIESGEQRAIAAADELQIGAYLLRVTAGVPPPGPGAAAVGAIPADWDPFATDVPAVQPQASGAAPPAAMPPIPADPFSMVATTLDGPLSAWEESVPPAPPPRPRRDPPPAAPPADLAAAASLRRGPAFDRRAPEDAVLSWTTPSGDSFTTIRASAVAAEGGRDEAPPRPSRAPASSPAPTSAAALSQGRPPAAVADRDALALAWREGLGAEGLPPEALQITPALLRLAGALLREAATGTIDLLAARAALKREIRAEMTMIAVRENNPLKFSASVDIALAHLLGAPERGFLAGEQAMRDAYEDLRAHQFATLAGMRAALEGIFARFDPAVLEGRLAQRSLVDSLVPSKRKARLWELFNEMYGQLAAEASDDFHELFGKAFLQAYEEHIGDLAREERP